MDPGTPGTKRIDEPLYSSRLMRNYAEYVKKFHPDVDMDDILNYAWMTTYELEDQGHWFSQWQVDRFHERLAQITGDSKISRKVGRYVTESNASGLLRRYALSFMSPGAAYWFVEKIAPHLTRAHTFKSRKIGPNKIEVVAIPNRGVHEGPCQCENRIGMLEAMSKLFTKKYARVEHPTCLHAGHDRCRYVITWERSASFVWRSLRNRLVIPSLVACLALLFFVSSMFWTAMIFLFTSLLLTISFYFEHLDNRELTKNIEAQRDAAELLLDQINIRYNESQLVKEIGQATSMLMDTDELLKSVVAAIEKRLDFDRGGIWLANQPRTRLVYHVGFGYSEEVARLLEATEFRLDYARSRGVAVQAFRQQRPFLVNDIRQIETDLSEKSLAFARKLGAKSFICVPIVYERESLGILFVDNVKSKRPFSQSDISLLTGVATQVAICLRNALSYQKLRESEEGERSLRKLFEKYVPAPIIRRYSDSGEVDLFRGEEKAITAMFLDIRGFTSSSESMEAADVVSFLNSYFEKCSLIITQKSGHINKYTGDGFFAVFGAPEPLKHHVILAFDAAKEIHSMSKKFILEGKPMKIGIGLHTGRAIVGNIGSQTKIEYTAIGDTVNTAARLQEVTKIYHEFPIIMSRSVWEALVHHPDHGTIVNLGEQKIRGKKEKLEAFGYLVATRSRPHKQGAGANVVALKKIRSM
ncbi:MAG: adenylate/guanylate cyclase domain-containing protein [Deltaproteobacteria bacterium]